MTPNPQPFSLRYSMLNMIFIVTTILTTLTLIYKKRSHILTMGSITLYYSTSTIISISTEALLGNVLTPIADLACSPFSPKISVNKSDAALMT